MLKENFNKIETLEEGVLSAGLIAAMRDEDPDDLTRRALNNAGSAPSWEDCIDQVVTVKGFDLIKSNGRVYQNQQKNRFEDLIAAGAEVHTADGTDSQGKPLGKYVMTDIAFVGAITEGCRPNISVNTLMQYAKTPKAFGDKLKGKSNILNRVAPTAADYCVANADLVGKKLKIVFAKKETRTGSNFATNYVAFEVLADKQKK